MKAQVPLRILLGSLLAGTALVVGAPAANDDGPRNIVGTAVSSSGVRLYPPKELMEAASRGDFQHIKVGGQLGVKRPHMANAVESVFYLAAVIDNKYPVGSGIQIDLRRELKVGDTVTWSGQNLFTQDGSRIFPGPKWLLDPDELDKADFPVQLLIGHTGHGAGRALVMLTRHPNPMVRMAAALSLENRKVEPQEQKRDALLRLLNDQEANVRLAAILALGPTPDFDLWRMNSEEFNFSGLDVHAFTLADPQVVSRLVKVLESEDPVERLAAVDSLGVLPSERAIIPMIKMLKDENPYVRHQTAICLDRLIASYRIFAPDPDDFKGQKPVNITMEINGENYGDYLKKLLRDLTPERLEALKEYVREKIKAGDKGALKQLEQLQRLGRQYVTGSP